MDKPALRKLYKGKRKELSDSTRAEYSLMLREAFLDFLQERLQIRHLHIFLPIGRLYEIDTFGLVEELMAKGYQLYTSVSDFKTGTMETILLQEPLEYELDSYGIPVPHHYQPADPQAVQLVLMPLLAFDKEGNRLGYGKGFYDRFLGSLDHQIIKVGMSYFSPEENIPAQEHDIRLDFCLTPSEIFEFKNY